MKLSKRLTASYQIAKAGAKLVTIKGKDVIALIDKIQAYDGRKMRHMKLTMYRSEVRLIKLHEEIEVLARQLNSERTQGD